MGELVRVGPEPLERVVSLVTDAVSAENSKRTYRRSLADFIEWFSREPRAFNKAAVNQYRSHMEARGLAPGTVSVRMTAIRRLAAEAADNGLVPPEIAAGISRAKGPRAGARRTGNWLTHGQAERVLQAPDPATLKGKRDRALLAVLIGTGLRRREAADLTFEMLQQREARWVIADVAGKGGRARTVPVPCWVKAAIDRWAAAASLSGGRVFRAMDKAGRIVRDRMTDQAVFDVVKRHASAAGSGVAPHDLRRTFAKLAHRGKAPLEQIQLTLGHASVTTTERYLGVKQDLLDAPCDRLGLAVD